MAIELLRDLGFQINYNKITMPCTKLVFLGITIDATEGTLSLPDAKISDLSGLIKIIMKSKRASKKQLERLVGKMNFACQAIRGGRTFLRRIIDRMSKLKRPHHKAIVTKSMQLDLLWWDSFLQHFDGKVFFIDTRSSENIFVDACSTGGGCHYQSVDYANDWFYTAWDTDLPSLSSQHINHKELRAVLISLVRWAPQLANKRVTVFTDNMVTKMIISKGS